MYYSYIGSNSFERDNEATESKFKLLLFIRSVSAKYCTSHELSDKFILFFNSVILLKKQISFYSEHLNLLFHLICDVKS